jgi:hypothetical protein
MMLEKPFDFAAELGVAGAGAVQERLPDGPVEFARGEEELLGALV